MLGYLQNHEKPMRKALSDSEIVLRCDSGEAISRAASLQHVIFVGGSGQGKTKSGILPMLKRRIDAGDAGIIIDIKGNMGGYVRAMALEAGREVVEYGTEASATPMNLLSGVKAAKVDRLFRSLVKASFEGKSNNLDFHMRAAGIGRDCWQVLTYLAEGDPKFEPTMETILEMMNDPAAGSRLLRFLRENTPLTDGEKDDFLKQVEASYFHPLTMNKEKLQNGSKNTYFEQLDYNTRAMTGALRAFLETPRIEEKFCAIGAGRPNMLNLIQDNRIILLRFGVDSGEIGARLAREFLNEFYAAVYKIGLKLENRNLFVCIDEFQEIADLSNNRFSDSNFIALAREFQCGVMVATQSISSILNRGAKVSAVNSFVANCANKIFFFTDDEPTRELAKSYDPNIELIDLKPNQVFTIRVDGRARSWGLDSLNNEYNKFLEIEPVEADAVKSDAKRLTLAQLCNLARQYSFKPFFKKKIRKEVQMAPQQNTFAEQFPDLFTPTAKIHCPSGWTAFVQKVLKLFDDLKLGVQISSLHIDCRMLKGKVDGDSNEYLLNKLLAPTEKMCMKCGNALRAIPKSDEDEAVPFDVGEETYEGPICDECLRHYNLPTMG